MTPKEKALELFNKIYDLDLPLRINCIECGVIAVDEIIDEYKSIHKYDTDECDYSGHIQYWEEVKNILYKL